MIYTTVLVLCAAAGALAAPPSPAAPAPPAGAPPPAHDASSTIIPIISQSEELEPNGTYKFSFETGNGIKREEISYDKTLPAGAQARSAGGDASNDTDGDEIHVQQGSYSYTAPDGTLISLRYTADENGFQPVGDHLPTSPPIPENIQKSLSEQSTGGPDGEQALSARSGKAISSPAAAPAPAAAAAAPSPPEAASATEAASTPEAAAPTEAAAAPTEAASAAAPTTEAAAAPEAHEVPAEPSTQAAAPTTPAA